MPIPDYQSLMMPLLRASSNQSEVKIGPLTDIIADQLGLTSDERSELLPSGKQSVLGNRINWAKTYLAQAGLLESTRRGHFKITARGQEALSKNLSKIDNSYLRQFDEFQKFVGRVRSSQPPSPQAESETSGGMETPDETMRRAQTQINAALVQDLLERVRSSSPDFFERLIVNLLLSMGYGGTGTQPGRTLGRSGDGGVDGVIDQDALGLDRVYIQAKRYAAGNSVGSGPIRDFFGSLDRHKASKGLFVTTSTFSLAARETADFLSKRIVLIDGEQLTTLMIRQNIGCRIEDTLHIKKLDEEFFDS